MLSPPDELPLGVPPDELPSGEFAPPNVLPEHFDVSVIKHTEAVSHRLAVSGSARNKSRCSDRVCVAFNRGRGTAERCVCKEALEFTPV